MSDLFQRVGRTAPPAPLSQIGLGGGPLGNFGSAISDEAAEATIERAWERGIRYFDTAPHYGLGLSERRLGAGLAGRKREDFVVSSKVGRLVVPAENPQEFDDDGFAVPGDLARRWDFSFSGVERSLDESLERLGLDFIDVLFVHDPDQAWPGAANEGLESLAALKADGRVKAVGVGTNSAVGLDAHIEAGTVDVIMLANRYSLLTEDAVASVLEPAEAAGVAVVAVGVFGTGLLASPRPRAGATLEYRAADADALARATAIADICEAHGVDLPTAAMAYPLLHPAVTAVALGMRSPEEVEQNVARATTEVPPALWTALAEAGLVPATLR
ncbi:aldo/keto reductase [Agreia pratensis]|uniref:D-threo-aldose 1-dehydrogenase n=1 Tax=Agreia pratensis TaxID=150121 RepID=A0A1X7J9M4_9MICO|nr:aldo/keto reductase [Agreia pratensis]SMG24148.1 D-threo-aldose 1-dehydrogenase [Agreia pratensis]